MKIGYIRVSTQEQNSMRQEVLMESLGVDEVYIDRMSGKSTNRPELQRMMGYVRRGDTVIVESISRFARNTRDLLDLVEKLSEKGVEFVSKKEAIDTTTPTGKFMLAFYQNYVKKGMIYRADAEPNAALVSYIGSFVEAQEQQLFEDSFQLKDSSVDFYDETITIYYSWTNLRDEDANPMWSFSLSASQNGRELTQDYFNSETDSFSQLAPGCTGEYSITYYLHDTSSPVKLVVSNLYGDNLFADDRPGVEYEIKLTDGKTTSGSQSNSFSTGQSDSNGYELYEQFQQDFNSGNYTIGDPGGHYSGEEVRDYRSYDSGEELAELTLHDFGGYGEVSFYALGEGELHYDVTLVDSYSCSGYTADYFQFSDYTGLQDLLVLRSGSSEWLVTWNAHHPDGAVYEYEP